MIKTGEVKQRVTRCDFCSKQAEDIDDEGVARCEEHLKVAPSRQMMKTSAEKLSKRHLERDE